MNLPTPKPTHLRDARLRHALDHAPDAQAAPTAATRVAILRQAHAAVADTARQAPAAAWPWLTRLAQALSGPLRPWNAGFATVLLACVVAGVWWERDVPGPALDVQSPAPAAPAPASVEAHERNENPAPADQPIGRAVPHARERAQSAPLPARPVQSPPMSQSEPVAPPAQSPLANVPAETKRNARAPTPNANATNGQSAPASAAPAAQDTPEMATSKDSHALAVGPSRSAAGPGPARLAPAAAPDAFAWTALQQQGGAGHTHARGNLPADVLQAIETLLRTGATAVPDEDPVLARIALLHNGGIVLGVLELGRYSMRWTPTENREPRAFAARVEPATAQRIRDALPQ